MFEKGRHYIIGDKSAYRFNYTQLVGDECIYQESYNTVYDKWDTHTVFLVDDEDKVPWYIQAEDLLPVNYDSNQEAVRLLRRDK